MSRGQQVVQAGWVDVTVTDADGTEWTFELIGTESGPVEMAVDVEREPVEQPASGPFRTFELGEVRASVKVRGRLRARSEPAPQREAEVTSLRDLARGVRVFLDASGEQREEQV